MVTKAGVVLHLGYVWRFSGLKQGLDVELGLKWGEIFDRLPCANEFDRNAQLGFDS